MAEISIIVPAYNVELYLRACLDSILAQNFFDYEVILVDDGSSDGTAAICDEYAAADARFHVIHQQNAGQAAARNVGLDTSKGKWIAFIDSDDLVSAEYLSAQYDAAQTCGADLAVCRMETFTERIPEQKAIGVSSVYSGNEACLRLYRDADELWVSPCDKLYRRELFNGLRFPTGMIHEDQAIIPLAVYRANKVTVLRKTLYYYRIHGGSTMHNRFNLRRLDDMKAIDSCILFFTQQGEREIAEAAVKRRKVVQSKLILQAEADGTRGEIPNEYQMGVGKALRVLRENATDAKFTYYLDLVRPGLTRPYAYWLRLKRMLRGK